MAAVLLIQLPHIVIEKILSYLSYEQISQLRLVCSTFDHICQKLLNRGFAAVEAYHSHCLKEVRKQLPRRESERKAHPMSRHSEILTCVETRISLLGMTYRRFIDLNMCCFIPGKVVDEIYRVLRTVENTKLGLPRAYDFLQELRDISSMAMEHFDEKIAPRIKSKFKCSDQHFLFSVDSSFKMLDASNSNTGGQSNHGLLDLKQELLDFVHLARICVKRVKAINISLSRQIILLKRKLARQDRLLYDQDVKLREQERKTQDTERKLLEQQEMLCDLQKEFSQCKESASSWRIHTCDPCSHKQGFVETNHAVTIHHKNLIRKRKSDSVALNIFKKMSRLPNS